MIGAARTTCCRVVISIGLALHFLGHFGMWLGATGRIQLSYWQVQNTKKVLFRPAARPPLR